MRARFEVGMKLMRWDFLKTLMEGSAQSGEPVTAMGDKVRRTGEEDGVCQIIYSLSIEICFYIFLATEIMPRGEVLNRW